MSDAKAGALPTLHTLFPIFCSNSAIPACILALCDRFADAPFERLYWAPGVAPEVRRPYHVTPLPHLAVRLWYRLGLRESGLRTLLERKFLSRLRDGDVAYLWPACTVDLFQELARRGHPIVYERVNSHRRNAMRVLDEAYRRLGLPAAHQITVAGADQESGEARARRPRLQPEPVRAPLHVGRRGRGVEAAGHQLRMGSQALPRSAGPAAGEEGAGVPVRRERHGAQGAGAGADLLGGGKPARPIADRRADRAPLGGGLRARARAPRGRAPALPFQAGRAVPRSGRLHPGESRGGEARW